MACTSWNCGSSCAFGSGGCGCGSDCGGKCSSCASNNSFGWGSCTCGDNCSGGCSGTCSGTCSGGCSGGCNTTCTATCANNCDTACKETCTGGCGQSCNTGCSSTSAIDLYTKLAAGLNKKIVASDMQNINALLISEAARRSKTITSVSFKEKTLALADSFNELQENIDNLNNNAKGPEPEARTGLINQTKGENLIN